MFHKLRSNKALLIWAILAGLLMTAFALWAQIDLCIGRGQDWQGTYAAIDYDEPFYAAYLESLIDGKTRRGSPYSGAEDTVESPQKESYLSVQFLAALPEAVLAREFGLSSPSAMIFITGLFGFLSGVAVFSLIYAITLDAPLSFAGTLVVLLGGAMAAGQGGIMAFVSPDTVHYASPLLFLRRLVPAASFPAMILFFVFVWRLLTVSGPSKKRLSCGIAIVCFIFTVYGYFYHWTTAAAWFIGLLILWAIFRPADIRANKYYLLGLALGLIAAVIPYIVMLLNRSTDTDSTLVLTFTHRPDLWRGPALIGYAAIILIAIFAIVGRLDLLEPKNIVLMSFAVVAPIVFNQQILTGRSLQPFHYQLFSANYVALISISTTVFVLLKKILERRVFLSVLSLFAIVMLLVGCFESSYGAGINYTLNVWRDELLPVARRIKEISETPEFRRQNPHPVVMSFDFSNPFPVDCIELPSISSQAVLWGPHLAMFPDVSPQDNLARLQTFLYYQNLDEAWLRNGLKGGETLVPFAFFGGVRSHDQNINDAQPLTDKEIDAVVERYGRFRISFTFENARSPVISFVIVRRELKSDFDAIDRWYERDGGEVVGEYVLYRLRLREPR